MKRYSLLQPKLRPQKSFLAMVPAFHFIDGLALILVNDFTSEIEKNVFFIMFFNQFRSTLCVETLAEAAKERERERYRKTQKERLKRECEKE